MRPTERLCKPPLRWLSRKDRVIFSEPLKMRRRLIYVAVLALITCGQSDEVAAQARLIWLDSSPKVRVEVSSRLGESLVWIDEYWFAASMHG
jgi:hypothetical protein